MQHIRMINTLGAVALVLCFVSEQRTCGHPAKLLQLTAEGLKEHVRSGKTSLIYFGKYGEVSCAFARAKHALLASFVCVKQTVASWKHRSSCEAWWWQHRIKKKKNTCI